MLTPLLVLGDCAREPLGELALPFTRTDKRAGSSQHAFPSAYLTSALIGPGRLQSARSRLTRRRRARTSHLEPWLPLQHRRGSQVEVRVELLRHDNDLDRLGQVTGLDDHEHGPESEVLADPRVPRPRGRSRPAAIRARGVRLPDRRRPAGVDVADRITRNRAPTTRVVRKRMPHALTVNLARVAGMPRSPSHPLQFGLQVPSGSQQPPVSAVQHVPSLHIQPGRPP